MTQDMKVYGKFTDMFKYTIKRTNVLRSLFLLFTLMTLGTTNALGITITYHIINLGKLDNNGNITTTRTEALQFTSTETTLGVPAKYKSPLAKNWKYYQASEVTYNSGTKVCTFNSGPTLSEGDVMAADAHIYVTYELDETALTNFGVIDGGVCYIKFGNNKYLRQNDWKGDPNTDSDATLAENGRNLWKINIKDPYQITIQSKSTAFPDYYLSSDAGKLPDIRLKSPLSTAKTNKVWAFGLIPGGTDGTYRLIVADGYTQNHNTLDSFKHGYLNNNDQEYKTRFSTYGGENHYNCDLTFEPQANTYTYHIIDTKGNEAISYTMPAATPMGQALISYTDIPAPIRSPYLAGETVKFYNNSDHSDAHKITETPTTGTDIYVTYTTEHLMEKFLHLRGARTLNFTINGEYIYNNESALSHLEIPSEDEKTTGPYLWYFSGEDPYAIEISNNESGKKLGYSTPSSSPTSLLYTESPENTRFIIMATHDGGDYQQMELMAATGNNTYNTYYHIGRTDDNFNINTTHTGTNIRVYPNSGSVNYKLIDKAGKILATMSSKSGAVELPDDWKSPLVSEYQYWKESAFTIEGDVYTLKAEPEESDKVKNVTDVSTIYVTYKVNDNVDFNTTADAESGSTYRLQFVNGESFRQEDGKDAVMTTAQKAVYPYFCGDGMFYVYGNEQWNTQLNSGASTRSRWLWYVVSPTSDPYHVKIMSNQLNAKPINTSHGYFRTFPVTYTDRQAGTEVTRYVTSLTTLEDDAASAPPSEYMVLTGVDGHCKLVTVNEFDGAPENGSLGTRQTVKTLEQYWKNNPTVQNTLGGAKVTQEETYSDNITLTSQQENNLPDYWHTYQTLANSAPWVGWTGDNTGTGRQYKNKNHWFQTINMSTAVGSDGEFEFIETTLQPQVILIDNHGWEIMRKPLYDKDGNVNSELKLYDSPMVQKYYWHPTSTKADGYHKYNINEGDEVITIYYKNDAGKWVPDGNTTTFTSNSLYDDPYVKIKNEYQEQDASVKTDFYVTYDVKPEYANLYRGADTESEVTVSAFWVKQGSEYAKNEGNALTTTTVETDDDELKWNVKPNFNIDAEMGYHYNGEYGEKSKDETEAEYVAAGKNGFDPYNIQIQSVSNTFYYFKTNTTGSQLSGGWSGTSTNLGLQQMSQGGQNNVAGNDQTKLTITNATFMVVKDESDHILLMPRFDHTKVVNSFSGTQLTTPDAATQTLELKMAPKVIHYSSEFAGMNGQYFLADDFEFVEGFESLGSEESPFTGSIDGGLHPISTDPEKPLTTPLIAYAEGAIIKNVILDNVNITTGTNVGAIVANATGETRIYNCGINNGSVGGTGDVGGIVGNLYGKEITVDGKKKYIGARVINCYSYANVTGGTNVGGIVGNNDFASTASKIATMVMNCMFYGDITGGTNKSPVYGGNNIANLHGGLNTYNYYAYQKLPTAHITDGKYNSALAIYEKYLNRFEFYRLLLNSNKKLAAFYASSSKETVKPSDMMKWVLETADRSIAEPKHYPVLKAQGYYHSIINYDVENAPDSASVGRNHGGKLGKTLTVHLSGTGITTSTLTLQRMDKDFDRFNFNYDKVQLPYFNEVGTGNYTNNQVVTGWEIVSMTGGTPGTYKKEDNFGGYNFADRKCTNKDLFSQTERVFSQGAYFDVPYGVSDIYIQPHWATAVYVADEYLDVVYNTGYTAQNVNQLDKQFPTGKITINGSEQVVYTSISAAIEGKSSSSVYDLAVVLVGNLHQSNVPSGGSVPFTVMSADLDHDNEPDYSMIYHHKGRTVISPIRFDFLNIPGTCQAQKPNGVTSILNFTIFKTKGWFETTNTCLVYSNQVEYENKEGVGTKASSPLILLGGDFEQFVSTQKQAVDGKTTYIHVGSNVNIDNFGLGTHGDGANATPHIPVSVTGGEFKGFYLTGTYNPNAAVKTDNAECYISGGHFVEAAGACQEQINGNVHWQIYDADIDAFYGGGINDAKPITGTITTEIINSHVGIFCGGPKFGNMTTGKAVTTTAIGCVFDEYFGAGYGGLSYSRIKYNDDRSYNFDSTPYQSERGKYYTGTGANTSYAKKGPGVATDFDYEFFVWSSGETGSRKYVKFASFSLAQCNDVSSNLTNCTINQSFYGGGSLGKVTGKATSVLDGCTVHGNVFGGGFSANVPKVPVRDKGTGLSVKPSYNSNTGMFEPGEFSGTTNYEWKHVDNLPADGGAGFVTEEGKNYVVTNADLTTLGQVKETDLTVKNNCLVEGAVYGGGDESSVNEHTLVKIQNEGGSNAIPNVYGGGNTADVDGNTEVNMMNGTVSHDIYGGGRGETTKVGGNVMVNIGGKTGEAPSITYSGTGLVEGDVYGGSALGAVNTTDGKTTTVNVYGGTVNGSVFGGGLGQVAVAADPEHGIEAKTAIVALSQGDVIVNVERGAVKTAVYGGSNVNGVLKKDATVTLIGGTVGDSGSPNNDVVFGGGKGAPTLVNGNVTVNVGEEGQNVATGATIHGHVYGGGALGNTNEEWVTDTSTEPATTTLQPVANTKTLVNLYAGTINGYAYGGALGSAETPAYVGGDVTVTLDGAKVQQVFGANNINGTPKGHVLVHVKRTTNFTSDEYKENTEAPRTSRTTYDVQAVYGGGNMADYVPTDACLDPAVEGNPAKIAAATAEVLIEGCQKTSINYVYGGGNAAAVPATDVTVKGSYIINTLYGGGNGSGFMDPPTNSIPNPGANIGIYKDGETPTNYGTGKAVTKLLGGYINNVYGGSNTKGDVRGGTDVSTKKQGEVITGDCCSDLYVGEIYGAGSHADVKGDVNITLDCLPDEFVDAVYGGAEEAVIEGNVTLTVTSGRFGRVFGGNNKGGNIQGSITVNIYEDGCKPLIIGEVYGGGNAAPYSIYGCSSSTDPETGKITWKANKEGEADLNFDQEANRRAAIQVNIIACTSVGKVFGGGMGSTAKVIGNTNVDVNLLKGIVEGVKQSTIGKVGQVFGGGGEADVIGNTLVEVGTKLANEGEDEGVNITRGTYTSPSDGTYLSPEANEFMDMPSAGIYGGGLAANVDGNTTLNIGTKNQQIGEDPSVIIAGDIFGGGLGKDTHVTGNVTVNIGTNAGTVETPDYVGYAQITGDVYGGSAKGTVNSADNVNATTDSYTKVNFYGGTITGNLYGGGEGQRAAAATGEPGDPGYVPAQDEIAANVYGPVTVTMLGGSVYNVFGCNNYNGAPKNTVTVNINGGTVNFSEGEVDGREGNVYGGGNQAAYTAPDGNKDNPVVNVNNGTITRNVFGGGLGTTATVTGNPHVTIGDNVEGHTAAIKWSVYGGGSLATVDGSTHIVVNSGTIGTPKDGETVYGGAKYGNIYGGGFGSSDNVRIGLVKGNTNVTVNGGNVLHNIYGGGAYGSVGTYTYASEGANAAISSLATANTGKATIRIIGGTVGTNGHENGMIFGASRGDIDRPGVIQDNMAWVYDTEVIIGTEGQGEVVSTPSIKGSVYGSGENGHTYHDASVTVHSGMVGITDTSIDGGAAYAYRGNVYGGGCGTDKYYADPAQEKHDGKGTLYNPTAGIVRGNATVTIDGGHVVRNVYGAGAMGSVTGQTTVNISGKSIIGADGSGGGYVYAAARGADDMSANCATVGSTALNISGGTVWGSAFGGGQLGTVKGSVAVNVSGGVVKNDVYGGGALANTNTDNWTGDGSIQYVALTVKAEPTDEELAAGVLKTDVTPVAGYFTEAAGVYTRITNPDAKASGSTTYYKKAVTGTWADGKTSASNTTTVRLTGGLIGNAYGGGLGNSTTMANVYGDVTVEVNRGVSDPTKGIVFNQLTEHPVIGGTDYPTPVMGRVFGCNNYNGTPTGEVTVHVYSTRQIKKDTEGEILPGHGSTDRKFPYEIQSVYGGGNQADYLPATGKKSHVIIEGCDETSIEKVYGGCNSAVIPETDVLIKGCYDIGYGFGGGNGGRPIKKEDGNWYENEGAIVIGTARIECQGGKIGQVFGGGDSKGSCGNTAPVIPEQGTGTCPLWITRLYGAGNEGDVSHVNIILAACSGNAIEYVHGGSYNAHVHGNVNLTITSGILKNVYGGNDSEGGIEGNITVNIEETDGCNPIIIQNLVGGGNEAAFPGTLKSGGVETPIDRHGKITVNVKSATRIDNIYGGSFNAEADADTEININMMKGNKAGTTVDIPKEFSYIPNISGITNNPDGKTIHCTIDDAIGTIGNVFGGGKQGIVKGNTQVNINSSAKVYIMKRDGEGRVLDTSGNPITTTSGQNIPAGITIDCTDEHDTKGAHITGNVFGGGENADVTGSERASDKGNTFVNICANPDTYAAVAEGAEKVTIDESVYGGGSEADVLANARVTMAGGYVYDGVYGGGLKGSVGTFTRTTNVTTESNNFDHSTHSATCLGKPTACADGTGTCTVVVSGGQVGPIEVATKGMKNTGGDGPVDVGFVFGAGRGDVENPNDVKDADFHTFVNKTDVTISGGLIMASVYGGGENGRVLHDTHVTISGGQIGCGEAPAGVPKIYSEEEWASASVNTASTFKECLSWDYKAPFLPHDPYAQTGDTEDAKEGTDGHTYYGSVFGGGSGYFPYLIKNIHGSVTGHEWLRSAGAVYGNTVIDITGGHILTCVYGGNETTDVGTYSNNTKGQPLVHVSGGKCTINMVGGTLGVPRTDEAAQDRPVTCYLFGAGKGDQRTRFNTWTNVQETEVNVSGTARIFGSVFGGGEDGHILGNAQVNIGGEVKIDLNGDGDRDDEGETFTAQSGLKIGTTGTSYVDGNVFGGGRGFSGLALTAGSTGGNADVNIAGGTMLGSIYGGGRLASVGIDFTPPTDPLYGQLVDDDNTNTHGHITVNISGGTIGNDVANAKYGGNVFGGSMGRITLLDGTLNPIWPKQAVTKDTEITITGDAVIKKNVYGGSEFGIVRDKAIVNIGGTRNQSTDVVTPSGTPTIHGSVYGAGYGSDDNTPTYITAGDYASGADYVFTPMIWTGCVAGDTEVNIAGGTVKKNVYGGGEVASVGLINCHVVEDENGDITIKDEHNVEKKYRYTNITKHNDIKGTGADEKAYGFALSWPYKFEFISGDPRHPENIGGKTTVNITGGRIGTTTSTDNAGFVFGGSKGQVSFTKADNTTPITDIDEQVYAEAFCANVRETEININYASTPVSDNGSTTPCIVRTVYGGSEDGHVMENAVVNLKKGWIGRMLFGGGKGISTYKGTKYVYNGSSWTETGNQDIHSWTAGKVYGNTTVTIEDGKVGWFVYGGGNMASVGKGNYAGGADDYSKAGYGEKIAGNLWTSAYNPEAAISESNKPDDAYYFLNSGKTTVNLLGGTIGTASAGFNDDGIPYGSVFGGSRGTAAIETSDVATLSPLYNHIPEYYLGYVNKTVVNVGGTSTSDLSTNTPTIYGSIYGGAQDGHVRNSTEVKIFKGNVDGQTSDVNGRSGHVFGAGSGIGKYVDNNDGDKHKINSSSGSVTCTTLVELNDGSIAGNIYGGGAMASVGPQMIGGKNEQHVVTEGSDHKSVSYTRVDVKGGSVGGSVYGAGRGPGDAYYVSQFGGETPIQTYDKTKFATDIWSDVTVSGGTIGENVYGGGQGGIVKESTTVSLTGGDIAHDAYGGGQGTQYLAADIFGNTTTELNKGVAASAKGCTVKRIFGCNDRNGTPKGHVLVHVYATQHKNKTKINDKYTKFNKLSEYTTSNYESATDPADLGSLAAAAGLTTDQINAYKTAISGASGADAQKAAIDNYIEGIAEKKYDVLAVYGGGDLAPYVPNDPTPATPLNDTKDFAEVIIDGCDLTSIKQVYGGSNAASVPATKLTINSAYEIHESFGGGNGKDNYELDTKWYENPGANIGYSATYHHNTSSGGSQGSPYAAVQNDGTGGYNDATTKEARIANYAYGTGRARIEVYGGRIHRSYGGSNERGNIRYEASSAYEEVGSCPMIIDQTYGGGKNAETDADIRTDMDCVDYTDELYGGSTNGDVNSNIVLNITNGTFGKVFGGNKVHGRILGSITVNVKETGCKPIIIDKLYIGGDQADYSIYGYSGAGNETARTKEEYDALLDKTGITVQKDPRLNIISATRINNVYGGGFEARVVGSPHINVNMEEGTLLAKYMHPEYLTADQTETRIPGTTVKWRCRENPEVVELGHDGILPIGTIGNIYGGGDQALVDGSTTIEIGTGKHRNEEGEEEVLDPARSAAYITGRVYGGGNLGDVSGNATIEMGNGYVYDRIYGGGKEGHVGTISTRNDAGKPTAFAENTGKTTVTISGGHVGPFEYSHLTGDEARAKVTITPMSMQDTGADGVAGPDDYGYVFGGGRGELVNPATDPDINNKTYVNETEVTIKNGYADGHEGDAEHITSRPLIAGGVYGGSENGRVLTDTHVNIQGGQIGIGKDLTTAYAESAFIDPTTTTVTDGAEGNALAECAAWDYGKIYEGKTVKEWLPYDEHAGTGYDTENYGAASTTGSDGHTFYGNVFGGGSGYFAYETDTEGVYEWLPSAGLVEGDTYVNISGGHILTNVYGGNEMTNVTGTAHVTMTGGTLGVPRTLARIAEHPVTCYLFGGGKGDQRVHFNKSTNVGHAKVNVSGGIIYGSVFGGGEDGHVLGDVTMNISDGAKIGTWGTSYVEGNVFGGGRGFGGDAYTAGNVAGSVTLNITGGTMLGSVYGGGRLGSVGYGLFSKDEVGYGTMRADNVTEDGFTPPGGLTKGRGHVTVNISGDNTVIGNKYEYQNVPTDVADLDTWKTANHVPQTAYETTTKTVDATTQYIHRLKHTRGGNVFAGGMGRYTLLDGTPISTYDGSGNLTSPIEWKKLGNVKSTKLTISGNPWIMGNVYGGGEFGAVQGSHQRYDGETALVDASDNPVVASTEILFTGGTVGTEITTADPQKGTIETTDTRSIVQYTFGSIYGGGMGQETHDDTDNHGGDVKDSTYISMSSAASLVRASVYGGGEMAIVEGNTRVNISNGKIGRKEVMPLTDKSDINAGYVLFGGATMGNVYGGGKGVLGYTTAGQVKGNTNVNITGGEIYHMVYGGGALGSVGTFSLSNGTNAPDYIPIAGVPYDWKYTDGTVIDPAAPAAEKTPTGTATVTITGGTIGISGRDNGLVFGSSRGGLVKPVDEDPGEGVKLVDPYDRVAWVNKSIVTIGTSGQDNDAPQPQIKGSVYGGGENGHNNESATVNVYSGTIGIADIDDPYYDFDGNETAAAEAQIYRGNVYGGGSGSDTYTVVKNEKTFKFYNPKSGMVGGNTFVNIAGGHVGRSVYGGGSMASVGTITNWKDTTGVAKHADIVNPGTANEAVYGFALSWPYKFVFASGTGKATVNVTGGHIGTRKLEGGDVYGSSRGVAGDRYMMAHLAWTKETEVNINYTTPYELGDNDTEETIQNDLTKQCITGSVHGSGENGYVYGDTHVTLFKGLIGHSLYGGGKGKGTYKMYIPALVGGKTTEHDIYGLMSGRVLGNTYVTMYDGHVLRNVYGGGNMGSVGKGNYAGGLDDYYPAGYGETLNKTEYAENEKKLWDSSANENSEAFLSSGKTFVKVFGGTVGYINATDPSKSMKNDLPYGNVIGGSAGEAAPNISEMPRYLYSPAFFSGYVNETDVNIGGYKCTEAYSTYHVGDSITAAQFAAMTDHKGNWEQLAGPTILASVYGGGQEGHVRRWTHVTIGSGTIGIPYNDANKSLLQTADFNNPQWLYRGNVYGAGSGITKYAYDFNGNGQTHDESGAPEEVTYDGKLTKEEDYSTSAGSVAHFTTVDVLGGTIYRNVLGGGSLASVGPPKIDQSDYADIKKTDTPSEWGRQSLNQVTIGGVIKADNSAVQVKIGEVKGVAAGYGGHVFGGSRGDESLGSDFGSSIWTKVTIKNGAIIHGDVFGGGNAGKVMKDTEVKIGE